MGSPVPLNRSDPYVEGIDKTVFCEPKIHSCARMLSQAFLRFAPGQPHGSLRVARRESRLRARLEVSRCESTLRGVQVSVTLCTAALALFTKDYPRMDGPHVRSSGGLRRTGPNTADRGGQRSDFFWLSRMHPPTASALLPATGLPSA